MHYLAYIKLNLLIIKIIIHTVKQYTAELNEIILIEHVQHVVCIKQCGHNLLINYKL